MLSPRWTDWMQPWAGDRFTNASARRSRLTGRLHQRYPCGNGPQCGRADLPAVESTTSLATRLRCTQGNLLCHFAQTLVNP
jgi:hypothetical protein